MKTTTIRQKGFVFFFLLFKYILIELSYKLKLRDPSTRPSASSGLASGQAVKKTLLITQDFPPLVGGIANYYFNRVQKIQSSEVVVLMDFSSWSQVSQPETLKGLKGAGNDASAQQYDFKISYKKFFTKYIWPHWIPLIFHAFKIIKKEKPDRIWVGQVLPVGTAVWLLSKILKIKYFVTTHGNDLLRAKFHPRKFKLARKILKDAEYVEANTKFTKNILLKDFNIDEDKIKIVYPENNLSQEQINKKKVTKLKSDLNLESKKVLLTVARLVKSKGVDKIIKCMPDLLKQIPNLVYIIIGDGSEKQNLQDCRDAIHSVSDKIIFTGNVPHSELPNYYSLADCFILVPQKCPTLTKGGIKGGFGDTESFGIVYLEALEFGLPVIAGNVGGVKEIENKNIYLVDPNNLEEIKENILKALKN